MNIELSFSSSKMKRGILDQIKDIVENKGGKVDIPIVTVPIANPTQGSSPPGFDSFMFANSKTGLITKEGVICSKCGSMLKDRRSFSVHAKKCQ